MCAMREARRTLAKRTTARRKQPANPIQPRYELDNGPLTNAQMDAIDRLQPPGRGKVTKTLF